MLTAIIIIASIAQVILSLFVFSRARNNLSNKLFFFIGICTLGWALADYLSVIYINSPNAIYTVRAVLFFVVLQNAFFYMFARTFPKSSWKYSKKWLVVYGMGAFLVAVATLSPFMFQSLEVQGDKAVTDVGPLISIFIIQVVFSTVMIFSALTKKLRSAKGADKSQLQILLFASFLLWIIVPITNFGITQLTGTTIFTKFAPVYTVIFTGIIAYAIVIHKLFDIKRAVARSVAYLLSLGFIGLIYGGAIFLLSSIFVADNKIDNIERVSYILLALLSALLYAPTKKFFDRLTNKIFYRDAYDSEEFLDELNAAIVGNIELGILLRHSTKVIQRNLKSEHCFIEVLPTPTTSNKIIGVGSIDLDKAETEYLMSSLGRSGKKILITDQLGPGDSKLKNLLSGKNIGIITRLIPNSDHPTEAIANLIIGTKKSGNVYDKQDVHVIEIISDELLIAIENALRFEEIQGFAAKLQAEVNTATSKLQRTNRKLRELDETKDEFISMASHQLRTPLTSVKGYMSMVLEGDAGKISKQQRELLNQAFVSSQRMVYLIADLLNVSRLKTGKFIIESTPTNLAEVIEGEIDQLRETAKSKNIEIEYKKPKDFPTLALDETKIRQVIMNFADNAIYYTPSGGNVKVELSEDKSNVYFKVTDNGLGVPKSDIPHLFTKFYRASNARKARPDGTGLGLFMAKKVIDSQGGNLLFESEENKGSMFGFCFEKKKHLVKRSS